MQDDSKVYDVGHDTADVPVTEKGDEARLIKDKEHVHFLSWYGPFIHWAMGVAVPFEYKSGLFGVCLQRAVSSPPGCTHEIVGDPARSPTRWDILALKSLLNRY